MQISTIKKMFLFMCMFCLTSCAVIFENNYDVMARHALFNLMQAQENYRMENHKYANKLVQLSSHGLKYNTGIVYIEIHSASKDEYRAISLPAESSTARVFIYDTSKGGYYEADEVEVSKYVLGALNFIRSEKAKQKTNTLLVSILLGSLVILGFRFVSRYKGEGNNNALIAYFISLPPLGWAIAAINHLSNDVIFSSKILTLSWVAIALALSCVLITVRWLKNRKTLSSPTPILGLAGCSLFISLISLGSMAYTLIKYYPT
ncbi:MAG: hypothetical protein HOG61_04790 [Nitrospina sp.]|nr:hypothetical protein [Nitrospina sp.]